MKLDDLRTEYLATTCGKLIRERVHSIVESFLRKRDPGIYARGASDYRDSIDDVVQEFILDVLLGEQQLAYVFDVSVEIADFDRLMNRQAKRYLARTRERTIVDTLLKRGTTSLEADDQITEEASGAYRHISCTAESEPAMRFTEAAAIARNAVPPTYSAPTERNPKVYTDDGLRDVLRKLLSSFGTIVSKPQLEEFFEHILTPWTTTVLDLDEGVHEEHSDLTPEEIAMVQSIANSITEGWSQNEALAFDYKLGNISDARLADRIGVSRPTAANLKNKVLSEIHDALTDVDSHLHTATLTAVANLTDRAIR
jgi:predicted DNA binding protein